ncbi:unnamed protein product [Rotaria sordida]|uniref:Uncharacterized protein n=1 Tax=Rotaria sordida TaxID=392033 RepID=A0A813TPE2_9BILA|nr:unnamed protein product [Rotaria sordida]
MEQYLNLVLKNYTASFSQNSNENLFDEHDSPDIFADNDLHYKIPFWIGVIVISLLFLSVIIATIRYCFYTLCSSHMETEKMALMPPKSPCLSSNISNRNQRQKCQIVNPISHNSSDDNETSLSSIEQSRDNQSNISIMPINHHHSRSYLTTPRRHRTKKDIDHINNVSFSPTQISSSHVSVDFRKKVHDIYVLPVSPALSSLSSSTTTNTDEIIKIGSKTMPSRFRRHLSSSKNIDHDSTYCGIQNNCFADSPKPKDRILRYIQPPSQPPPLPPMHFNNNGKLSSLEHHSTITDLNLNSITIHFNTNEENQIKKSSPPPVPYRLRKPSQLPIGLEESKNQSDQTSIQFITELSPQDDCLGHTWPKPPESMSTSEISEPSSISYDHLIPTIIMQQNSTKNIFHRYQHDEHSILTESET